MEQSFRPPEYGEWFTVVDSQPARQADLAWHVWTDAQFEIPAPDDIRIDHGRADFGTFRRYRVRRSALAIHRWWEQVAEHIPLAVRGLWFGLTDIVQTEGPPIRTAYVSGAATFDAADDAGDWACDPIWEPADRYLVIPEISTLPAADWLHAEERLAQLIRELSPQVASVNIDGVATGFDDGSATVVWKRDPLTPARTEW